jgi:hypothetical protein
MWLATGGETPSARANEAGRDQFIADRCGSGGDVVKAIVTH